MSGAPPRTLAGDLTALWQELRLGYVEIDAILEGTTRFGGETLDRVFERLSRNDWHRDLEEVVHRIHMTALRVLEAKAMYGSVPHPLRKPEIRESLREARRVLEAFSYDVDQWRNEIRGGRISSMPRRHRPVVWVEPSQTGRRDN